MQVIQDQRNKKAVGMFLKRASVGLLLLAVVFSNSMGFAGDSSAGNHPANDAINPSAIHRINDETVLMPGALSGGIASENEPNELANLMGEAEETMPAIKDHMKDHVDQLPTIFELATRLELIKQGIEKKHGRAVLLERVNKDEVLFHDKFGKAELKIIDGALISRIVLFSNDVAYLLINEGEVSPTSKHLETLITKTHFDLKLPVNRRDEAGHIIYDSKGRPKLSNGRHLMLIWMNSGKSSEVGEKPDIRTNWRPIPKAMTKNWWKEQWIAHYKKPTVNDFTMAVFWGVMVQGTQVAVVSAATKGHVDIDTMLWYQAFGVGIGTYITTYKNIINSGYSRLMRTLKAQPVSQIHSVGTIVLIGDKNCRSGEANPENCELGDRLASLNIMTPEGAQKIGSLGASEMMDAFSGDYWNQLSLIYERARLKTDPIRPFTWLAQKSGITALTGWKPKKDLNWNRNNFRNQFIRMIGPSGLSMAQRFTIGATDAAKLPGTDFTMPVFQFIGIPIALGVSKTMARIIADDLKTVAETDPTKAGKARELEDLAQKYEKQWAESFGIVFDPMITNQWQTDPLSEVSMRIVSLSSNLTRASWNLLMGIDHKVTELTTGAAGVVGEIMTKTANEVQFCADFLANLLTTDIRDLAVPKLSPPGLQRLAPAKMTEGLPKNTDTNRTAPWNRRSSDTD